MIKEKLKKVWGMIYLCIIKKALHLQLGDNYSTNAAITALTSIFAIRILPQITNSDAWKNLNKSRKLILETGCRGFSKDNLG